MRCFQFVAFVAVMSGEKALCRAIHERASASIVLSSSSISSSCTDARSTVSLTTSSSSAPSIIQAQRQITACKPASIITTTVTTTVTATAPTSTTLSGTAGKETDTQPPAPQPSSGNNTAQIIGIAMGSSAIVGIVAAFFFFAGHRSNRRRLSTHDGAPNSDSFRRRLGRRWRKQFNRNTHSGHGATAPAELETPAEMREVSLPPERPANNEPYFNHLGTAASSSAEEFGSEIGSYSPLPPPPPAQLPPLAQIPPLRIRVPPIELPTSDDPGDTPLPEYEERDDARRHQIFSWAASETSYRPDKFAPSNII